MERGGWCAEIFNRFCLAFTPPDKPIRGKQPAVGILILFLTEFFVPLVFLKLSFLQNMLSNDTMSKSEQQTMNMYLTNQLKNAIDEHQGEYKTLINKTLKLKKEFNELVNETMALKNENIEQQTKITTLNRELTRLRIDITVNTEGSANHSNPLAYDLMTNISLREEITKQQAQIKALSNNATNLRMIVNEEKGRRSGFSQSLANLTRGFNEQQMLIDELSNEISRLREEQPNQQTLNNSKFHLLNSNY